MKKTSKLLTYLIALFLVFNFTACTSTADQTDHEGDSTLTVVDEHAGHDHATEAPHWSYEGETGPANWGGLSEDYSACNGTHQSPIDLTGAIVNPELTALALNYLAAETLNFINNGHTVQVNYPAGSTFTFGELEYELKQFHFHAGSEHTVDGVQAPMEVHLVHLTPEGDIAVIGILFKEGEANEAFSTIWDMFPAESGASVDEAVNFDLNTVFPEKMSYFNYSGSLTTPPCTEAVQWVVLTETITASAEQIESIKTKMPTNNFRPVQALNDRSISVSN